MGMHFKSGTWNVTCDVCGREYKSDEVQKRWDGLIVCKTDWEARHISDFIRTPPEAPPIPFTRPEPPDGFIPQDYDYNVLDTLAIDDTLIPIHNAFRQIPNFGMADENFTESQAINEFAFNAFPLAGGRVTYDPEAVEITDQVGFCLYKTFNDSITLSESITGLAGKGVSETMAVTELVSFILKTPAVLDGAALNEMVL